MTRFAVVSKLSEQWVETQSLDDKSCADTGCASLGCGGCPMNKKAFRVANGRNIDIAVGDVVEVSASTGSAFLGFLLIFVQPVGLTIAGWAWVGVWGALIGFLLGIGIILVFGKYGRKLPEITAVLKR